jgi:hypothetical protein
MTWVKNIYICYFLSDQNHDNPGINELFILENDYFNNGSNKISEHLYIFEWDRYAGRATGYDEHRIENTFIKKIFMLYSLK